MNQKKSIFVEPVSIVKLEEEARKLADIATRLDLVARAIETVQYQQTNGDTFAVTYFLQDGQLALIYENLDLIKDDIRAVSNDICQNQGGNS